MYTYRVFTSFIENFITHNVYGTMYLKSSSFNPLVVMAGVPSLMPPGTRALLSPGTLFLLSVIWTLLHTERTKCSIVFDLDQTATDSRLYPPCSTLAPSIPLDFRRFTRMRWLSVPPDTIA